jgi:hypothetical protein
MVSPTQGLQRWSRASWLGVVGFVLSLVAHVAAGGAVPRPMVLVLLAGFTALVAVLLTGVLLRVVRIGVSLIAMQVLPHEVFMWLGAPRACVMTAMGTPAGDPMGHSARLVFECVTGMADAGMGGSPGAAGWGDAVRRRGACAPSAEPVTGGMREPACLPHSDGCSSPQPPLPHPKLRHRLAHRQVIAC